MKEETSKRKAYLHLRERISKDEVLLLVHKKYKGIRKLLIYSLCGISLKYFYKAYKTRKVILQIGEIGPRIGMPIPWQKALSEFAQNFLGEDRKISKSTETELELQQETRRRLSIGVYILSNIFIVLGGFGVIGYLIYPAPKLLSYFIWGIPYLVGGIGMLRRKYWALRFSQVFLILGALLGMVVTPVALLVLGVPEGLDSFYIVDLVSILRGFFISFIFFGLPIWFLFRRSTVNQFKIVKVKPKITSKEETKEEEIPYINKDVENEIELQQETDRRLSIGVYILSIIFIILGGLWVIGFLIYPAPEELSYFIYGVPYLVGGIGMLRRKVLGIKI